MIVYFSALASCDCECGYTDALTIGSAATNYLFTDIIETDFIHDQNIAVDTDWIRQLYNGSAVAVRGNYGYVVSNIRLLFSGIGC